MLSNCVRAAPSGTLSANFREPPTGELRRIHLLRTWVNKVLPRGFVILPDHGEHQHVPRIPLRVDFGAAQLPFEPEPGAFGYPCAGAVLGGAADLHALGAQVLEGEGHDAPYRLGRVPLHGEPGPDPIADFELWHRPVYAVQSAASHQGLGPFEEQQEAEIGSVQEGTPCPAYVLLLDLDREFLACPGHPRLQFFERFDDGRV